MHLDVGVIGRIVGGVVADVCQSIPVIVIINDVDAVEQGVGRGVRIAAVKILAHAAYVPCHDFQLYVHAFGYAAHGYSLRGMCLETDARNARKLIVELAWGVPLLRLRLRRQVAGVFRYTIIGVIGIFINVLGQHFDEWVRNGINCCRINIGS